MMNGTISVQSEEGIGSIFEIVLKNIAISSISVEIKEEKSFNLDDIIFDKAKILIVDDIESNRILLTELFNSTNIDILCAENGQEAVFYTQQYKPDLILMDIRMPIMNGYEATDIIKKDPELKHIPVIALTASVFKEDYKKSSEYEFNAFLTKPIQQNILFKELCKFLKYTKKIQVNINEINKIDKDLNQNTEIPQDALINLSEILVILNSWINKWDENRKNGFFNEIEQFGNDIKELGEKYSLNILKEYAENLILYTTTFDIDNMNNTLDGYPNLIKKLEDYLNQ